MGALSLTLDYNLRIVTTPGYGQSIPARAVTAMGAPASDSSSNQALWAEPMTGTLLLKPLQLRSDYLLSPQPLANGDILRLGDFTVNQTDLTNQAVFEQAGLGNANEPWIYHVAIGPTSFFPGMAGPESALPSTPPSLLGIDPSISQTDLDVVTVRPNDVYLPLTSIPAYGVTPTVTKIGTTSSGRYVAQSKQRLPANQALFFRWFQTDGEVGFPATYSFYVGQFCLNIKEVVVEVWQDISPAGDRSQWKRVAIYPLFSVGEKSVTGLNRYWNLAIHNYNELKAHDRSLLWLPLRRNQVLLLSGSGRTALLQVRPEARRLPDDSDWDITRADTVVVWVMSPTAGRFQVQKIAYPAGTQVVNCPQVVLDFNPGGTPAITIQSDHDHGSALTGLVSGPPSYTLPDTNTNACPRDLAIGSTDQSRLFGIALSLTPSSDRRWSPAFYDLTLGSVPAFGNWPNTPLVVSDTSPGSRVVHAEVSCGMKPGEGRATLELLDDSPYTLAPYYYRADYPLQLKDGTDVVFTGITNPQEVTPLKLASDRPRRLTLPVMDRWKQLTETWLRDQRDWQGVGHMTVVQTIMQQAGIDTTGMVLPPASFNTPLGGLSTQPVALLAEDIRSPWKPHIEDTAATFIERIAERYAGWDVGFYADGTPFYLPKFYYTTPEVTFYASRADAVAAGAPTAPLFRDPVTFTTQPPEANVVFVRGNSAQDGGFIYSPVYVDWASIKTPAKVNYIGKYRVAAVVLAGAFTCAQITYIARIIFNLARRRWVTVRCRADFVPTLKVGHCFTLGTYGNYRLRSYSARFEKNAWVDATLEAELIETGY